VKLLNETIARLDLLDSILDTEVPPAPKARPVKVVEVVEVPEIAPPSAPLPFALAFAPQLAGHAG
jgi:hypothetical protein